MNHLVTKKKILFLYDKYHLEDANAQVYTGWVPELKHVYDVRYWGKGFVPPALLTLGELRKVVDAFKPDYLYLTIRKRYVPWLPDLSSISVPKIFVESDTCYYNPEDSWYQQFDKVYCRFHLPYRGKNVWESIPIFRWSVSAKRVKETMHQLGGKRRGFRFLARIRPMYKMRSVIKSKYHPGLIMCNEIKDWDRYWDVMRSTAILLCPKESGVNDYPYVPPKVLEYLASGAAVVTSCDLTGYGFADLEKYIIPYTDLKDLDDRIFGEDLTPWYNVALETILAVHTDEVRYKELFDA